MFDKNRREKHSQDFQALKMRFLPKSERREVGIETVIDGIVHLPPNDDRHPLDQASRSI